MLNIKTGRHEVGVGISLYQKESNRLYFDNAKFRAWINPCAANKSISKCTSHTFCRGASSPDPQRAAAPILANMTNVMPPLASIIILPQLVQLVCHLYCYVGMHVAQIFHKIQNVAKCTRRHIVAIVQRTIIVYDKGSILRRTLSVVGSARLKSRS